MPNIVSIYRGDHLKHALPHTALLGAIFVLFSDIIGRLIVYPYEINIGLTLESSVLFFLSHVVERKPQL